MLKFTDHGLSCPSCGHDRFEIGKQCSCGYQYDKSFSIDPQKHQTDREITRKQKNVEPPHTGMHSKEFVIKEIDSWTASFSPDERCICLGTPALQSFRLKLTVTDLEELLECMYHHTGQEKTTRKLSLSVNEVNDLIENMHTMIEEKRAKVKVQFSDDELQKMAGLINSKLKT